MMNKPKRESPVSAYIDHHLKARATRVSAKCRQLSVSRIIEECLEKGLPEIERRVGVKRPSPKTPMSGQEGAA